MLFLKARDHIYVDVERATHFHREHRTEGFAIFAVIDGESYEIFRDRAEVAMKYLEGLVAFLNPEVDLAFENS